MSIGWFLIMVKYDEENTIFIVLIINYFHKFYFIKNLVYEIIGDEAILGWQISLVELGGLFRLNFQQCVQINSKVRPSC